MLFPEFVKTKKCLYLPLIKNWFDLTELNIKTEDYRDINSYWISRLIPKETILKYSKDIESNSFEVLYDLNEFKKFDFNFITLGYPNHLEYSKILIFEHSGIIINYGCFELGANPDEPQFIIKHGNRVF